MRRVMAVVACALLLGACAPDTAEQAAPSSTAADQGVRFAQCMRDNGVDVPDPGPDAGKLGGLAGVDRDDPAFTPAMAACKQHLPGGGDLSSLDPAQLDKLRAFAGCMREHGVEMPDPDPNGGKPDLSGVDRTGPAFQAAFEACQDKLPELVR
ncbi:hypothetical protein ABZ816_36120 [Actinosynnema sp. NPDC047251]|uniref:Putative secreted protein n=1 Tax=Saccharothrix espanaensis (strain ATCC 51144 / DSM 44229 / JCM 9112 / NBRC 15066 / NRRL 15764) TaxID=1179773 RepID=K0JUE3_SACES|nr:hypothetical protein [Saccharothrix espanaensis]CCH29087.1 putative secreted protein [Saccharothrix espanaensis DSM 44229]